MQTDRAEPVENPRFCILKGIRQQVTFILDINNLLIQRERRTQRHSKHYDIGSGESKNDPNFQLKQKRLSIGAFERIGENIGIQRTGIDAGELIERRSVNFFSEPAKRIVVVLDGKDVEVMYGYTGAFERGDMRFAISLSYVGTERLGLTPELEQTADLIAASFEWMK